MTAEIVGVPNKRRCPACGVTGGAKLNEGALHQVAGSFFVQGSVLRTDFGGAPRIQANTSQTTSVVLAEPLQNDARLIERATGLGFFHYGPRLWMIGEIEPLKDLQSRLKRRPIIDRILSEFPEESLGVGEKLYRVRLNPSSPGAPNEYDSPPAKFAKAGRLNAKSQSTFYASSDLQVCLHECRVSAEDDIYVATMDVAKEMKILDLTEILDEEETEFESLDLAVHMVFLARSHAYPIAQAISKAAKNAGFEGIRYPSYFSLLRTGGLPFETSYGLSNRRLSSLRDYEKSKIVSNLAIFGRPVSDGRVSVRSMNRFVLSAVQYGGRFGPSAVD
ncbi:RES family NAD+ phosphorylase [Brevundimonas sp. TSRC1-1]|uniref:RES family NAD+ phosphorylase n=1 Tax=Brevundimonas sp. TSRC1-1 TaxID=2804562 RepID=UPI003CF07226